MKRTILALSAAVIVTFACTVEAAQQEVAPDHFDSNDYRVQPATKKHGAVKVAHGSPAGRRRRAITAQSRSSHETSRKKQVTEVR